VSGYSGSERVSVGALSTPSGYRVWTPEKIRYQDVDRYGHVNNVAFSIYAESGRVDFLEQVSPGSILGDGSVWVIARLITNFLRQVHYPGEVRVGTRALRLGRSSATLGQGLFVADQCFATAESVVVLIDSNDGHSLSIPAATRAALEAHISAT